jgi:uncharacterized RDD family membrane protein YckC
MSGRQRRDEQRLEKFGTFWRRFWAGAVDAVVLVPLVLYLNRFVWNHAEGIPTFVLLLGHVVKTFSFYAYTICLHARFGQTLGKMAFHVKVVDVTERAITVAQAIRRDIVPLMLAVVGVVQDSVSILRGENLLLSPRPVGWFEGTMFFVTVGWFCAEVLTLLANRKRRAVHDFIAGTVVVRIPQGQS